MLTRTVALRTLALAGAALNERQKVKSLREAVEPCGHFTDVLSKFIADFPLPANQQHAQLATRLKQYAQNKRPNATTGSVGYASNATQQLNDALNAKIISLQEQLDRQFALVTAQRDVSHSDQREVFQAKPRPNSKSYCWTHGECYHNSQSCRTPAPGHKRKATLTKRMGGK